MCDFLHFYHLSQFSTWIFFTFFLSIVLHFVTFWYFCKTSTDTQRIACYIIFNFIKKKFWKSKSETKAHCKSSQVCLRDIWLERCSNHEENHRRQSNAISHREIQMKTTEKCQVPRLPCSDWRLTGATVSRHVSVENSRYGWPWCKSHLENSLHCISRLMSLPRDQAVLTR